MTVIRNLALMLLSFPSFQSDSLHTTTKRLLILKKKFADFLGNIVAINVYISQLNHHLACLINSIKKFSNDKTKG